MHTNSRTQVKISETLFTVHYAIVYYYNGEFVKRTFNGGCKPMND